MSDRLAVPEKANAIEAAGWTARIFNCADSECPYRNKTDPMRTDWLRGWDMADGRLKMIAAGR